MRREDLENLPHHKLAALAEAYLRAIQAVDGFWFLGVEQKYGTRKAIEIDQAVWERVGKGDGERFSKALGLKGGVAALRAGLTYGTCPGTNSEFSLEESPTGATVRVTRCYPQETRLRAGKAVFDCEGVCQAHFRSFAQALDPRFQVSCSYGPPEHYSPGNWCQWNFELKGEA